MCDVLRCVKLWDIWCSEMCDVLRCLMYWDGWCSEMFDVLIYLMFGDLWCSEVFKFWDVWCSKMYVWSFEMCDILWCVMFWDVWCSEMCDILCAMCNVLRYVMSWEVWCLEMYFGLYDDTCLRGRKVVFQLSHHFLMHPVVLFHLSMLFPSMLRSLVHLSIMLHNICNTHEPPPHRPCGISPDLSTPLALPCL